jgi:Ca2+-binding RTX toxin-like protein
VRGSSLNDTISGNGSNNTLDGVNGNDILDGRGGNDTLTGGGGADTFVFNTGFGNDVITDFTAGNAGGHDFIDFSTSVFADYAAVTAAMTQVGANVVIAAGADTVTVNNVNTSNLVASDFLFH